MRAERGRALTDPGRRNLKICIVSDNQDGSLTLAQRRIFLVHYPHYAKAMALTGDYDLVCNGHEHRAIVERVRNVKGGETLRIDPGTVAGVSAPATCVFGDLQALEFEIRPVPL
jgi:uncharacterized protein